MVAKPRLESKNFFDDEAFQVMQNLMQENFGRFLKIYINSTTELIQKIESNLNKNIVDSNVVIAAHTIKSSSLQIGAVYLSDLAQEFESIAAKNCDKVNTSEQKQLMNLKNEMISSFAEVKKILSKKNAR